MYSRPQLGLTGGITNCLSLKTACINLILVAKAPRLEDLKLMVELQTLFQPSVRAGWDTKMPLGKRFPNLPLEKQCQGHRRAPSLNHEYCILGACILHRWKAATHF